MDIRRKARTGVAVLLVVSSLPWVSSYGHAAVSRADLHVETLRATEDPDTGSLSVAYRVRNGGAAKAPPSRTAVYLSSDAVVDGSDIKVGTDRVGPLRQRRVSSRTVTIALPDAVPAPPYLVIACVDATRVVRESSERNNCANALVFRGPAQHWNDFDDLESQWMSGLDLSMRPTLETWRDLKSDLREQTWPRMWDFITDPPNFPPIPQQADQPSRARAAQETPPEDRHFVLEQGDEPVYQAKDGMRVEKISNTKWETNNNLLTLDSVDSMIGVGDSPDGKHFELRKGMEIHAQMEICPDENGVVTGTVSFTTYETIHATSSTETADFENVFTLEGPVEARTDGKKAGIVSWTADLRVTREVKGSASKDGIQTSNEHTKDVGTVSISGDLMTAKITSIEVTPVIGSGDRTVLASALAGMALVLLPPFFSRAHTGMTGGYCAELRIVAGPADRTVQPGETVRFTFRIFHRDDGTELQGSVFGATVINALPELDHNNEDLPTPARFSWTAPRRNTEEWTTFKEKGADLLFGGFSPRGNTGDFRIRLVAEEPSGFPRVWVGTASGTFSYSGLVESWSATFTLTIEGDPYEESALYKVSQGTMQWSISGDNGTCSYSGSDTVGVNGLMTLYGPSVDEWHLSIGAGRDRTVTANKQCRYPYERDSGPEQMFPLNAPTEADGDYVGQKVISGSATYHPFGDPDADVHWQVELSERSS